MGGKKITGSEAGFEYCWRFSRGNLDEIEPIIMSKLKAHEKDSEFVSKLKPGYRIFVFQFRTDFILRPFAGGAVTVMDSERFSCVDFELADAKTEWAMLWCQASERARDYWMGHDEIKRLVDEAFDFARQNAGDHDHWVPVVVSMEVCTAQQEGESIEASMDRAIRAQYLMPLSVEEKNDEEKKACGISYMLEKYVSCGCSFIYDPYVWPYFSCTLPLPVVGGYQPLPNLPDCRIP
ncbi:Unknown protein [Striga hermonthica]|uniref:Uncharacterized protein n=1 Tax=Striga hermonthica TaxID=68872 RepID=A0A9N7NJC9_STRHE|nr:Unknown protein [Striga hermonthica]